MSGVFLRWGIPGFVTVVGGTAISIFMTGENIASDLTSRASEALANPQFGWASVSFDARDAVISGTATDQQMIDAVVARVAAVHGVRAVNSNIVLAEFVSPFPFEATVDGDEITLAGGVPDETAHADIVMRTGASRDTLRLMSGAPERAAWEAAVDYGLSHLALFDKGEVRLADLDLSVSGRARSPQAFDDLASLGRAGAPAGVRIAALAIEPALASPFEWHASFDGTRIAVSGHTPTEQFVQRLQTADFGGYPVSTSLVLASGAPQGFDRNALLLLENLVRLERGTATISDASISLVGAPADAETAATVELAMTRAGASVTLDPPRVAEYQLTAVRSGNSTTLDGFVPDAATRDRLEALDNVDAAGLELARGAPERFDSAVDFALEALGLMSEGHAEITGTVISIAGRATTVADFTALETTMSLGAPQGLILARTEIKPPLADPFVWSAEKGRDGKVAMSGYVPSQEVREALQAATVDLGNDASTLADGNPPDFEKSAKTALGVLSLLDTGKISYDGTTWSLTGAVDTSQEAFAAEAAFNAAGLREAGWTYSVALPDAAAKTALPIIDPYIWRAQKSAGGVVTLGGFVPAEEARRFFAGRAGGSAVDNTELGAGAPDGFIQGALAGLDALALLDEGSVGFASGTWSISGQTETAAERLAVEQALRAAVDIEDWQIAIQARDAAPIVAAEPEPAMEPEPATEPETAIEATPAAEPAPAEEPQTTTPETEIATAPAPEATPEPAIAPEPQPVVRNFVFEADKQIGAAVSFKGRVPADATKRWFGVIAGNVATDALQVGSGLPADFIPNADAGVRALTRLADGKFGLDGDKWVLTGRAETETERAAALASLEALPSTDSWEIDIGQLPPIEICRQRVGAFATRNAILFQSGSARMTEDSAPALDELAGYLSICPEATVHVEGHTDADGADDLNLVLSVARAEAVVNALIDRGVRSERLYAIGYGESLPIADNETKAGKQANRRIVFTLLDEHQ